jgi:hypothetical protein
MAAKNDAKGLITRRTQESFDAWSSTYSTFDITSDDK